METNTIQLLMNDGLWLVIVAGWIFLFATGLEADKPLSGGIPGHTDPSDKHQHAREGAWGRIGEVSAWFIFAVVTLALPVVLWWIFWVHGR